LKYLYTDLKLSADLYSDIDNEYPYFQDYFSQKRLNDYLLFLKKHNLKVNSKLEKGKYPISGSNFVYEQYFHSLRLRYVNALNTACNLEKQLITDIDFSLKEEPNEEIVNYLNSLKKESEKLYNKFNSELEKKGGKCHYIF